MTRAPGFAPPAIECLSVDERQTQQLTRLRSLVTAVHGPNRFYADKLDANHAPLMNGGPVIKVNANQRYASNSETQAVFRAICSARDIPCLLYTSDAADE